MNIINQKNRSFLVLVLMLTAAACGGGSGGVAPVAPPAAPPPATPPPPTGGTGISSPVVYLAAQDTIDVFNLYLADADNPGSAMQLNPPLPTGASIRFFDPSPDASWVVWASDQNTIGKVELFAVEVENPSVIVQLSPTNTPVNTDVQEFAFSPDSTELIYASDQDTVGMREIYLLELQNPSVVTKLNAPLAFDADVSGGFEFSPDGSQVLYTADHDINASFELFLMDKAVPGVVTKVNPPFTSFSNLLKNSQFSPDGNWILYGADQDIDGVFELYVVDPTNLGTSIKVHPPYSGNMDICTWAFSPDSMTIAYCADQDTNGILELYAVQTTSLGISTKLNPPLVTNGEVRSGAFKFSGDSSFLVYVADQDTDNIRELYQVELGSPGVTEKLNAALIDAGDVRDDFEIRADDAAVAYRADQDADGEVHLFEVALTNPGVSTSVHPALAGDDITRFRYFDDGQRIVYVGEQDALDVNEIYVVDTASLGTTTKINPAIVTGGQVGNIIIPVR